MKLATYNPNGSCPKCGHLLVRTSYRGDISVDDTFIFSRRYGKREWPEHEYLHRTCERCHYEWPERFASPAGEGVTG